MRWGYLIVLSLFAIIGVAVVRTYQLASAGAEDIAPIKPSQITVRLTTPTRSAPLRVAAPTPTPAKLFQIPNPFPPAVAASTPQSESQPPNSNPNEALVKWVDIPSAANKVGIKQFDVITVFDGTALDANHQLSELIRSKKPGDVVTLTLIRNHQTMQVTPQLRGSPQDNNIAYLGVRYVQGTSAPGQMY